MLLLYDLVYGEQFDDVRTHIAKDPDMAIIGFAVRQHELLGALSVARRFEKRAKP